MTYLLAGALLGFAGSSHCIVMCGPLLLAVNPTSLLSRQEAWVRMLAYHAGRVLTYAVLGVLVGYAGQRLMMIGIGRGLAVLAGALFVLSAAGSTIGARLGPVARGWSRIALLASGSAIGFGRRHRRLGYVVLGLANGLLPCGLLYAALAAAAASGAVVRSMTFMIGFGAGTIPLLLTLTMSASTIPASVRQRFRAVLPAVMALAGILLIARGIQPLNPESVQHSSPSTVSHHH
jgi:uncharacterized protein